MDNNIQLYQIAYDTCDYTKCEYNRQCSCAYSAFFGCKRPCKKTGSSCDFSGAEDASLFEKEDRRVGRPARVHAPA